MNTIGNYLNGEILPPVSGDFLENFEPATGSAYSTVPDSDQRDIDAAVHAAAAAFPDWSATPALERCRVLSRIADLIDANFDRFVMAESIDTGKPVSLARAMDIPRSSLNLRHFATAIIHERSDLYPMDRAALNYTLRRPRGVAGVISPWNLPLYLLTWKIAPALASGNTVVAKPSELTPMTAHLLALVCIDAGLPPGVLNIVHGTGPKAGSALVTHQNVPTLSFTGGTKTGIEIARAAAPMLKKYALELGGKNPTIVFADADPQTAMRESLRAAFQNSGQICLCGSRILVERPIYSDFLDGFVAAARRLHVGDPLLPDTQHGALVSRAQLEKTQFYVQLARDEGGKVLCGGSPPADLPQRVRGGFFFSPTVITGLPYDCRTNREEIFGPVVTITPFHDEEQAVEFANATEFGLSASVWTRDLQKAHRIADRIDAGTVWVNCWLLRDLRVPFGGMKQSGVGREGGDEALRFFTEPKNVCIKV